MSKLAAAVPAIALVVGSLVATVPEAKADGGQIAAGVAGGLLGGALLGSALAGPRVYAAPPPPVYYAPAPVYVDEPECRLVREQYWDGYGYRVRRVQVCD
ncbi:MAG: hypothetical protein ABIO35_05370 [Nitrobacter sp.]